MPLALAAVIAGVARGVLKMQAFIRRAEKGVGSRVIGKVFGTELMGSQHLGVTAAVGILIEGVVLEEVLDMVLLQIGVVLFTAVGGIRHDLFR